MEHENLNLKIQYGGRPLFKRNFLTYKRHFSEIIQDVATIFSKFATHVDRGEY